MGDWSQYVPFQEGWETRVKVKVGLTGAQIQLVRTNPPSPARANTLPPPLPPLTLALVTAIGTLRSASATGRY